MGLFSQGHAAVATQTDTGAAGSTHSTAIDASATGVHISATSSDQHFTVALGGDFASGNYGREFTVSGIDVAVGSQVDATTDSSLSTLTLHSAATTSQTVSVALSQVGSAAGATSVTVLVPSSATVTLSVYDWAHLATTLIYETVTNGAAVQVHIVQSNPVELETLIQSQYTQLRGMISSVTDAGIRQSLQAKLSASSDAHARGDNVAASNVLAALQNEVAAQTGKALAITQATAITGQANLIRAFLSPK
jgi:hypothetical protein